MRTMILLTVVLAGLAAQLLFMINANDRLVELNRGLRTALALRICEDKYTGVQVAIGNRLSLAQMMLDDFFDVWVLAERKKLEECGGRKS